MPAELLRQTIDKSQADGLVDLTDAQRATIQSRREILDAWKTMCRAFAAAGLAKGEATQAFLMNRPGLSRSVLYVWAAADDSGDPLALLDRRSTALRTQPGDVSEAAWQCFQELWLTPQQRSVKLCWEIVRKEAREKGWLWPGLRTIQRKVQRELPPCKSDYYRFGEREHHRRWGLKMRRDYDMYRSGQVIIGDFHQCDVFCRKSEGDWTIVRPLMVAWLDLRSRIIPAFRIVPRENQDAVLLSFADSVRKWGPPQEVVIDNGKPYRARGFSGGRPGRLIEDEDYVRSALGALEVKVHFSIPYNPDSKPIERWFKTLEEGFGATFQSYCGGDNRNPRFKEAHKFAQKYPEKCPTLAEYAEKAAAWIETYHNLPHSGDGMKGLTPMQAFSKFDPIARVVCSDALLDILLMRTTRPVKVTSYGVRHNGIEYGQGNSRLFDLQGQEVILRVDPHEAGYVIVCDLQGKPICKAVNNRLLLAGTTQENVADGMRRRNHARKLARRVYEGGTRAAMQDVTEAAIAARLDQIKCEEAERAARAKATGTDDVAPRNIRPLKGDWVEAVRKYQNKIDPPIGAPEFKSLADLPDDDDNFPPTDPLPRRLQDVFGDDDDDFPPLNDDDLRDENGELPDVDLNDDDEPAPELAQQRTAGELLQDLHEQNEDPPAGPGRRSRADEFFGRGGNNAG